MSAVSSGVPLPAVAPLPLYKWMRPPPVFVVNSPWSTPILSRTHSTASRLPVEIAVSGMSPSLWLRGMRMSPTAVDAHDFVTSKVTLRRQRPSWMTTGIPLPTGTFGSENVPSKSVLVHTSGLPDTSAPHGLHDTPCLNGVSAAFGTYTSTFGTGSGVPYCASVPATTRPVIVVGVPPSHATICVQRPVHAAAELPHTPG